VKNQFFVKEGVYAHRIGFLKKGIVRAFIVNDEGKEYTKQFFVGPSIIGAYTSLLTSKPAVIAQWFRNIMWHLTWVSHQLN